MSYASLKRHQRVNAILPTFVDTPMAVRMDDALGDLDSKIAGQPLGLIDPGQIAYLVEFLISDKSSYITGACIPVSAGADEMATTDALSLEYFFLLKYLPNSTKE